MESRLLYFLDPMCSWCWAFTPALRAIEAQLPEEMPLVRVLGGLAPDTDETMPSHLQEKLQEGWRNIQTRVPGTVFNFDYWAVCTPRRSTHRACRAVIVAGRHGRESEKAMIGAIQRAYYLEARNPSDRSTLVALAGEIGLDQADFALALDDAETQAELDRQILFSREQGVEGFPTLILDKGTEHRFITIDPNDPKGILQQLLT